MTEEAAAPETPQVVQPQPTPLSWTVGRAAVPGAPEALVVIQLHTVTGATVMFLGVSDAKRFANMILEHAGGLTVASSLPA